MTTIKFLDIPRSETEGSYSFKYLVPGTAQGAEKELGATPPPCVFPGGMEQRFLHVKEIVDDLFDQLPSFLKPTRYTPADPHPFLKPAAFMAIVAVENGPNGKGSEEFKNNLFTATDNRGLYNPRVTSASNARNIPQVTLDSGQEYGNDILDFWNYAESLRGAINHFNYTLHYVDGGLSGKDATLITGAMGYNAGAGHKVPSAYWNLKEAREYAQRYVNAYNQLAKHYYTSETRLDYSSFVTAYKLPTPIDPV